MTDIAFGNTPVTLTTITNTDQVICVYPSTVMGVVLEAVKDLNRPELMEVVASLTTVDEISDFMRRTCEVNYDQFCRLVVGKLGYVLPVAK